MHPWPLPHWPTNVGRRAVVSGLQCDVGLSRRRVALILRFQLLWRVRRSWTRAAPLSGPVHRNGEGRWDQGLQVLPAPPGLLRTTPAGRACP